MPAPSTSKPKAKRWWVLGVSVLACAALCSAALWARARWGGRPLLAFTVTDDASPVQREIAASAAGRDGELALARRDPTLCEHYLSPAQANQLFGLERGRLVYDPWCHYRSSARQQRVRWHEHPNGGWRMSVDERGLRGSAPESAPPDYRVLVCGDSHTFGVCGDEETFAALLEQGLGQRFPGAAIEVWNAGTGGYTFYNYLGVLEKFLEEDIDAFVLAVYGGNDFSGLSNLGPLFPPQRPIRRPKSYREQRDRGLALSTEAMGQCFHQALLFRELRDEVDLALAAARELVGRMSELCLERGIAFHVAYLPPPCEFTYEPPIPRFEKVVGELHLSELDLAIFGRIGDAFLAALEEDGAAAIDLRPALHGLSEPPFWRADWHLDVAGHAAVASALLPAVAAAALNSGKLAQQD